MKFCSGCKKDKETIKERCKKWRLANPKKLVAKEARRRGKKANAEGSFNDLDVNRIYDEQNGKCFYCGNALNGLFDVDHKTPLSRGGSNWPNNLCCACAACNRSKHTKTAEEFLNLLSETIESL